MRFRTILEPIGQEKAKQGFFMDKKEADDWARAAVAGKCRDMGLKTRAEWEALAPLKRPRALVLERKEEVVGEFGFEGSGGEGGGGGEAKAAVTVVEK